MPNDRMFSSCASSIPVFFIVFTYYIVPCAFQSAERMSFAWKKLDTNLFTVNSLTAQRSEFYEREIVIEKNVREDRHFCLCRVESFTAKSRRVLYFEFELLFWLGSIFIMAAKSAAVKLATGMTMSCLSLWGRLKDTF